MDEVFLALGLVFLLGGVFGYKLPTPLPRYRWAMFVAALACLALWLYLGWDDFARGFNEGRSAAGR